MKTYLFVLCVAMVAVCLSAQAAPINPDPMERYAPASPWTPNWTVDGWQTVPGDATFSISPTAGSSGNGIDCVNSDSSNNAFARWNVSLDTTANHVQVLEADYRFVSYEQDTNYAHAWYILEAGTPGQNATMGTGIVDLWIKNGIGHGDIYSGSADITIPGVSGMMLGNYYDMQFENDFANDQIRVRMGAVGGDYDDWSAWVSMDHGVFQPNFVTAGFFGTVDMDNFSLSSVPEPGSMLALGMGLLGLTGLAARRRK